MLNKVQVNVVRNSDCQNALQSTHLGKYFKLHKSFTCASTQNSINPCKVSCWLFCLFWFASFQLQMMGAAKGASARLLFDLRRRAREITIHFFFLKCFFSRSMADLLWPVNGLMAVTSSSAFLLGRWDAVTNNNRACMLTSRPSLRGWNNKWPNPKPVSWNNPTRLSNLNSNFKPNSVPELDTVAKKDVTRPAPPRKLENKRGKSRHPPTHLYIFRLALLFVFVYTDRKNKLWLVYFTFRCFVGFSDTNIDEKFILFTVYFEVQNRHGLVKISISMRSVSCKFRQWIWLWNDAVLSLRPTVNFPWKKLKEWSFTKSEQTSPPLERSSKIWQHPTVNIISFHNKDSPRSVGSLSFVRLCPCSITTVPFRQACLQFHTK